MLPWEDNRLFCKMCRVMVAAKGGAEECYDADAVVLAVGVKALQQCAPLLTADPDMQPTPQRWCTVNTLCVTICTVPLHCNMIAAAIC